MAIVQPALLMLAITQFIRFVRFPCEVIAPLWTDSVAWNALLIFMLCALLADDLKACHFPMPLPQSGRLEVCSIAGAIAYFYLPGAYHTLPDLVWPQHYGVVKFCVEEAQAILSSCVYPNIDPDCEEALLAAGRLHPYPCVNQNIDPDCEAYLLDSNSAPNITFYYAVHYDSLGRNTFDLLAYPTARAPCHFELMSFDCADCGMTDYAEAQDYLRFFYDSNAGLLTLYLAFFAGVTALAAAVRYRNWRYLFALTAHGGREFSYPVL